MIWQDKLSFYFCFLVINKTQHTTVKIIPPEGDLGALCKIVILAHKNLPDFKIVDKDIRIYNTIKVILHFAAKTDRIINSYKSKSLKWATHKGCLYYVFWLLELIKWLVI